MNKHKRIRIAFDIFWILAGGFLTVENIFHGNVVVAAINSGLCGCWTYFLIREIQEK